MRPLSGTLMGIDRVDRMKKKRAVVSIRSRILLLFILSLFVSVSCYGMLVFSSWTVSARQSTRNIAEEINEDIFERVVSFIRAPYQINEISHNIIEQGMISLDKEPERDRFFAWILDTYSKEISSRGLHASPIAMSAR